MVMYKEHFGEVSAQMVQWTCLRISSTRCRRIQSTGRERREHRTSLVLKLSVSLLMQLKSDFLVIVTAIADTIRSVLIFATLLCFNKDLTTSLLAKSPLMLCGVATLKTSMEHQFVTHLLMRNPTSKSSTIVFSVMLQVLTSAWAISAIWLELFTEVEKVNLTLTSEVVHNQQASYTIEWWLHTNYHFYLNIAKAAV